MEPLTADDPTTSSHRALVVDDDPDFCVLMREMLKWRGFEVSVAYSASDALNSLGRVQPEVMLVDIQMPEVDGLELIRRVRSDESFAKTPIIVITATAIRDMLLESRKAGADFFLTKPVSFLELDQTIDRIM
jgi:CheY-like chemotaxis protein